MKEKLLKPYNSTETEEAVYKIWEKSGFFNPDNLIRKNGVFSIVLPPPNVTGQLHAGHAIGLTLQDIMIRFARMQGKETLWLPGTDHAAIATQAKVEGMIYKEKKQTRFDLGREKFLETVNSFAKESRDTIINQTKRMGASLDWSREAYTLDPKRTNTVYTAFKKMFDAGLIYRGHRIVNWDPKLQTTVSDDELEYKEETTEFYYLKYGPFIIGTSRPETKFGDKYVVMHPNDKRYRNYEHGQKIELEWINGPISATVIKDEVIDMDFGSGVMTITPWHDQTDFDISERHNLEKEQIIDLKGKLLPISEEFSGIHIKKARKLIIEKLQKKGLVEKIDTSYKHNVAISQRSGEFIEPQILNQWFIDVNKPFYPEDLKIKGLDPKKETTLKDMMRKVVETKQIKIIPERFEKVYFHWIDNLRDWCISRQIWFGHRIPVWYKDNEIHCDTKPPSENWEKEGWTQDEDTLDTWFSSGLWTFSTLGWPENTEDFQKFHPTDVLETGYDILFFWVARMILMSGFLLGDVPFKNVYLHGLVRDEQGKKLSKSLGNAIDPLNAIEKYGVDAFRMALVVGTGPGNDSKLSDEKIKAYKHFSNKIWNISRFVITNTEETQYEIKPEILESDKVHIENFSSMLREITDDMENFRFYLSAEKLYHYIWHTFADIIIEESKSKLSSEDEKEKKSSQWTLFYIWENCLRALHPFMPFITEEIWSIMPIEEKSLLIVENWPTENNKENY